MFTGIVRGVGRIVENRSVGGDRRLTIDYAGTALPPPDLGASVAVNGACLTAIDCSPGRFSADVSLESIGRTNLGGLGPGASVNLEPASRLGDPLDGHLVTGHVDDVGTVVALDPAARSTRLTIELPAELARYVARKGSVTVDGVSLTVNAVAGLRFDVNIVPHTWQHTRIREYRAGTAVNIEVDLIARYLERLCSTGAADGINLELLRLHGYAGTN
jgi:riboflavin synthase